MSQTSEKSLYKDGSMNYHMLLGLLALGMIAASIYLTSHYFGVKYPDGLGGQSICNINDFFSCDNTANSSASNIFGMPISVFGIVMGLVFFCGYFIKNKEYEGTVSFLFLLNTIGCVALFFYSLIGVGGLCPVCTLYYILSISVFIIFRKISTHTKPSLSPSLISVGIALLVMIPTGLSVKSKEDAVTKRDSQIEQLSTQIVEQFQNIPAVSNPKKDSPYRLASATAKFSKAPIQLTIYSDFQCPYCKVFSKITEEIAKKYEGKINIQYIFYPLDINCNKTMQRQLHSFACKAAYLSVCLPTKDFKKVHDDIFAHQESLSDDWLTDYAKKEHILDCYKDPKTKEKVVKMVDAAKEFNIQGTPTLVINGRKIDRIPDIKLMHAIFDDLAKKE